MLAIFLAFWQIFCWTWNMDILERSGCCRVMVFIQLPTGLRDPDCLCRNAVRDISCFCLNPERAGLSCMAAGWSVWLTILGQGLLSRHCLEPIVPEWYRLSPNAWSSPWTKWRVREFSLSPRWAMLLLAERWLFKNCLGYDYTLQECLRWIKIFGRLKVF